ncbi:hypothetical protein BDV06DRAFT_192845 [Aspergillus oleicola]
MATFNHPLQCIQLVCKKNNSSRTVLVASAGAKLYSYSAELGQRLSIWPQDGAETPDASVNNAGSNKDIEGPRGKKRKVDPSSEPERNVNNGAATASATVKKTPWTSIPILTSTPDGEYLVALTGEDKTIRVFQIEEDGSFVQLSERQMPKRPCAITFMENNSILTGDKFGDVYSMPLLPSAEAPARMSKIQSQPRSTRIAATNLTVHTARNLRSLEMQEQQKRKAVEKKGKEGQDDEKDKEVEKPVFEHDLLLGHVSLLTDVAFASLPSPDSGSDQSFSKRRTYILSADRDEHIRVSRGPPQAHVIENYCFGHTAFISKLCVPEWAPEFLISGGGDPHLLVWKWVGGELVQSVPLIEQQETGAKAKEVSVRGIWASPSTESDTQRMILVALEGNPTLYPFILTPSNTLTPQTPLVAKANILDIQFTSTTSILISLDTLHKANSTTEWLSSPAPTQFLQAYQLKEGQWEPADEAVTDAINKAGTETIVFKEGSEKEEKRVKGQLSNGLYGLENLRKKMWDDPRAADFM